MRGQAPLGQPFWLIWTASTISTLGDGIRYVVFPLLAASITRDPAAVAMVSVAGFLPWPIFGLVGGVVVDRMDRRRLMWQTDILRGLIVGVFAVVVVTQSAPIEALAAVSFVLGVAATFFDNAASAIVPMLVDEPDFERANSWLFSSQTIMSSLIGAPVGGALFALSAGVPLTVDAVTFIVAAALVAYIPGSYSARSAAADSTVLQDIGVGLRWLGRNRLLRTLCLLLAVINATFGAAEAVLVLYSLEVLHVGTFGYTLLLTATAFGGLFGSIAAPKVRNLFGLRAAIAGSCLLDAAALALAGVTSDVFVAVPLLATVGATGMIWGVITISLRQRIVPAELLGRVTSSYRVVGLSAFPVGAAAGGFLAKSHGLHAPYLVAGVILAVATIVAIPYLQEPSAEVIQVPMAFSGGDWRVF